MCLVFPVCMSLVLLMFFSPHSSPPLPSLQGRVCPPLVCLFSDAPPSTPATPPPLLRPLISTTCLDASSPALIPLLGPLPPCSVMAATSLCPARPAPPRPSLPPSSALPCQAMAPLALHVAALLRRGCWEEQGSPRWWFTPLKRKRRKRKCSGWRTTSPTRICCFLTVKQANICRLGSARHGVAPDFTLICLK